jgi:NAD(P)-dependent dehydrogenase (short-subunit alcohol dehydrogenase family)
VTEQTADSYAATFDTNVLGTPLSIKHELRVMLAQRSGAIVTISSTSGHAGANVILFLCSEASFTTGQVLPVDGGKSAV